MKAPGRVCGCCAVMASVGWGAARAQDQAYNVDFFQGPIVSSNRVIGLGGAYIGVAEGADGHLVNPAAFGLRALHAIDDDFDWDFALSWFNVAPNQNIKLDRSKQSVDFHQAGFTQAGFNLKLGRHGFGLHISGQRFTIDAVDRGQDREAEYSQTLGGLGYAYTLADQSTTFGVMLLGGTATLKWRNGGNEAGVTGGGLLLGALHHPLKAPWRVGAVWRTPIISKDPSNAGLDEGERGRLVPDTLLVPWELGVGASYMFGPRPYNPRPRRDGDAPERHFARGYVLFSADLVLTGPSEDAVGVNAFLNQQPERSGREYSVGARLGAESEVIDDRLVLRGGAYYEPDRFSGDFGRPHATMGGDLRFTWGWRWKLSTALDIAEDYKNFGLGLGLWY